MREGGGSRTKGEGEVMGGTKLIVRLEEQHGLENVISVSSGSSSSPVLLPVGPQPPPRLEGRRMQGESAAVIMVTVVRRRREVRGEEG